MFDALLAFCTASSDSPNPIERAETPVTGTSYRQVGVKLWGVGADEREPIDGGGTRYKQTLSRVEANDIIVNKIWARNGSVAVIPTNLAGCYVSGVFCQCSLPFQTNSIHDGFIGLQRRASSGISAI